MPIKNSAFLYKPVFLCWYIWLLYSNKILLKELLLCIIIFLKNNISGDFMIKDMKNFFRFYFALTLLAIFIPVFLNRWWQSFTEKTVSGSFMPMCTETHCFTIRGIPEKSNVHRSVLYNIKSFEPFSFGEIFTLPDNEEPGPAAEMNGHIYLASRSKEGGGRLIIRRFSSADLQQDGPTVIPNAHPSMVKGYDALWFMSYPEENHYSLLRVDPVSLSVTLYPLEWIVQQANFVTAGQAKSA